MTSIVNRPAAPATSMEHRLRFPALERDISVRPQETVLQSARRHGLRIVGACGGRGRCGTCVVRVIDGELAPVDAPDPCRLDAACATEEDTQPDGKKWLRACQMRVRSDCTLEVAARSLATVRHTQTDASGTGEVMPLEPAVLSHDLTLAPATLSDAPSDADRIARALAASDLTLDLAAAQSLSSVLRAGDWSLRVRQRGRELIDFAPVGSRTLGLAVDLGTSNIAAFLMDLESGECLASLALENPQSAWGADLISRIDYAMQGPDAAQELRAAVLAALNGLALDLCHAIGLEARQILDAVICGNTAMQHLALGLSVRQLGRAPFVAALRQGMDLKARDLGLALCPGAWVHLTPSVGGFVGGDHVAALLATQPLWRARRTSVLLDIGTNTEISLIHDGQILCASCPSGPALEGGHIACGMRAALGAIDRVALKDGRLVPHSMGNTAPVGLCGSGVIDALAAMRRAGIVDAGGRLSLAQPEVVTVGGKRALRLAAGVHFTQDDVRAVQLAKAAIRTGIELLLRELGLAESALELIIIAGAFGAHIDIHSSVAIGLFPDLPSERFEQVGNSAGLGARQMLCNLKARQQAAQLAASCRYVELSTRGDFQKTFLQHIGFPSEDNRRPA